MLNKMGESSCAAAARRFSWEVEGVPEMAGAGMGNSGRQHFLLTVEEWLLN